ncbi:hypothetical protein CLAFUW4_14515 [Fulvia fulva]|uniref:Uncharacterized protein n=1 Tax=Passalora fulva TaxID=5499 RepID=A0A9Q8UWU5_PASFU|nr:uncharacterized protein CLAFUR5_14346 [Fulvia fulva]KAK4609109.1 hypothetical protein CLAFUR4_14510 [Fulvia fulva]UJO25391.1 hypothetical protein CLAFUR5_14346 [Fulvia fulva]WPV22805.1 hypothetical protein CLAFUW4_14515 [Fulvia fulva]WPV37586.1 hypothetical protein CLAFUW7_14519 [Fulvia fulva]
MPMFAPSLRTHTTDIQGCRPHSLTLSSIAVLSSAFVSLVYPNARRVDNNSFQPIRALESITEPASSRDCFILALVTPFHLRHLHLQLEHEPHTQPHKNFRHPPNNSSHLNPKHHTRLVTALHDRPPPTTTTSYTHPQTASMLSAMTAVKAAAILAFPLAYAADLSAYEGYSAECITCNSWMLTSASNPSYFEGDNPLVAVCAAGNDKTFRPCDKLCIDKFGHSLRQNKCAGSVQNGGHKQARQTENVIGNYEGYSEECTQCYSNALPSAFQPPYTYGDNPLTAVCASGNDQFFRPCDQLCIDQYGHTFRQSKCAGSGHGLMQARQAENVFSGYEGYSEDCTSCFSNLLSSAYSPAYTAGDNPLTAVCASGNNDIFKVCDAKCVDEYGHTFRQNKCAGSVKAPPSKRDSSCEICWKTRSSELGCNTPFVIAGHEFELAGCMCQPGKIDSFKQCDAQCNQGGMFPSYACAVLGLSKRHEDETTTSSSTSVSTSTTFETTTKTVDPSTTSCNSTTSLLVAPAATDVPCPPGYKFCYTTAVAGSCVLSELPCDGTPAATTTGKPCPSGYKSCYTTAWSGLCILPELPCPGTPNPLGPGPVSANSTIPFASGTIGLTHPTANATTGQPSEAPPTYNNGASGLGGFGAAAFSVVAVLMGAFA